MSYDQQTFLSGVEILDTTDSLNATTSSLVTYGGASILKNTILGGQVNITDTTQSLSLTTGALTISGGLGVIGNTFLNNTSFVNSTQTNILNTNISSNSVNTTNLNSTNGLIEGGLTIRRNTNGWNPSIYLNPPASGNENYMIFNNISGGPASIGSWLVGTPSGATGGTFQIGFANTTYALNIMTSGNVGIGTATPSHRLHVEGSIYANTTSGIILNSADRPLITRGWDEFTSGTYSGVGRWGLFMEGGGLTMGLPAGDAGRRHQFVSYNANSTINRTMMTILETGNVGIGTTSPGNQLTLSTDSAAKPSTNTWTISSDERIKTNITQANLDICYNNVKNIPLKRYTWKDSVYTHEEVPDRSKLGWIAQDVEQYIPKAVEQKEMHGYSDCRTLNSDQIIASLYGAVQKLISEVETLKSQLNNV